MMVMEWFCGIVDKRKYFNPLMPGGNKRSCVLKQTCSFICKFVYVRMTFCCHQTLKGLTLNFNTYRRTSYKKIKKLDKTSVAGEGNHIQ